jgi:hypothetical protein
LAQAPLGTVEASVIIATDNDGNTGSSTLADDFSLIQKPSLGYIHVHFVAFDDLASIHGQELQNYSAKKLSDNCFSFHMTVIPRPMTIMTAAKR